MDTDNTQEPATPSPASAGSHGDAVGWILFHGDRMAFDVVFDDRDEAEKYSRAYERKPDIVPVYRSPTLTDEEREAIERSAAAWEADAKMGLSDGGVARTLRGLLHRLK